MTTKPYIELPESEIIPKDRYSNIIAKTTFIVTRSNVYYQGNVHDPTDRIESYELRTSARIVLQKNNHVMWINFPTDSPLLFEKLLNATISFTATLERRKPAGYDSFTDSKCIYYRICRPTNIKILEEGTSTDYTKVKRCIGLKCIGTTTLYDYLKTQQEKVLNV